MRDHGNNNVSTQGCLGNDVFSGDKDTRLEYRTDRARLDGILASRHCANHSAVHPKSIEYDFGYVSRRVPIYPIFYLLRGDYTIARIDW